MEPQLPLITRMLITTRRGVAMGRGFASLPAHTELQMPSLSPTMNQVSSTIPSPCTWLHARMRMHAVSDSSLYFAATLVDLGIAHLASMMDASVQWEG